MNNTLKIAIDLVVITLIYFFYFFRKWQTKGRISLLVNTSMYLYLTGVLYFTLMPIIVSIPFIFNHPYIPMHLNAFEDYSMARGDAIRQIVLNVIMTMPFGFLLPICKKWNLEKCSIYTCLLYTVALSMSIELLQPLIDGYRSSDITDIITNTVGGLLGYIIYLILQPVVDRVLNIFESK